MDTTKLVTPVPDVDLLAVREQEKPLLVLRPPIVYVHKIRVLVPTEPLLPGHRVPHTVPTFARLVPVDTTKMVTPALDVDLLVVREQEKRLLVLQQLIVYVPQILALV